jgi:hypothetical protein
LTNSNNQIENNVICHKCKELIALKEVKLEKLRIHASLFFDPFNFYSIDFVEREEEKPVISKEI